MAWPSAAFASGAFASGDWAGVSTAKAVLTSSAIKDANSIWVEWRMVSSLFD
jgi:hypothetical protein